jgi:hypothetical protein
MNPTRERRRLVSIMLIFQRVNGTSCLGQFLSSLWELRLDDPDVGDCFGALGSPKNQVDRPSATGYVAMQTSKRCLRFYTAWAD